VLTSPPLLLVRADGGPEIGIGHVMRCLGVAQAWRGKNAPCAWARAEAPSSLEARLIEEGIESVSLAAARGSLEDARELAELARARGAAWTLVDGYRFDLAYQEVLAGAGLRVAWMDDRGAPGAFVADLVVNPNVAIRSEWYERCDARTRVLRGPRHAPLRREFNARPRREREFPARARRILISLGGADPDNASLAVMRAAVEAGAAGTEVRVIAGPANPHLSFLQAAATPGVEVVSSVVDMAEALEWADVAVTGAGGTVWEALYLGVPTLLVVIAGDQRGNAVELDRRGVVRLLGDGSALEGTRVAREVALLLEDRARRQEMSLSGRALVDGRGASRIVAAMREAEIGLRRAETGDSERLFQWANDPVARAASFSGAPIPWDDHRRWLEAKLADPACVLFVGTTSTGDALGTVRFEREAASAIVSTTVDPSWRDRGYGAALIRAACRAYLAGPSPETIEAYVKEENEASRRAFLAAGFDEDGRSQRSGVAARRLVLSRTEAAQ
jgi:UDP-2,4-diacetamido-2,4,6-trideoxy-beta-L-altropyranose hydrolase